MARKRRVGRPAIEGLTDSQKRVYLAIESLTDELGMSPTYAEIGTRLGLTAMSAYKGTMQLCKKGFCLNSRKERGIAIIRPLMEKPSRKIELPLLGTVAAGYPVDVEENVIGTVSVEANLIGKSRCFALRIVGKSMIKAGIDDGDIVIVRQQPIAETGDIIVACVDGATTVKRLYHREGLTVLRPANDLFRPIRISDENDFRVIGKVISIQKSKS